MLKVDYETADQRIRTPSYVFDTDVVNARIAMIKKLLGERVSLCYAMKANAFIIDTMQDHIDRYEVCSPGEFRICERAGIPMEKIVMSGVYNGRRRYPSSDQNVWDRNRLYGGIAAPVRTDRAAAQEAN